MAELRRLRSETAQPRKARNPRTGEHVDVEAKNVVTFQPGKTMEGSPQVREAGRGRKRRPRRRASRPPTRSTIDKEAARRQTA
ncbi:MAG: HU family DNA-binding protein [Gemmataceae bacterium]